MSERKTTRFAVYIKKLMSQYDIQHKVSITPEQSCPNPFHMAK